MDDFLISIEIIHIWRKIKDIYLKFNNMELIFYIFDY